MDYLQKLVGKTIERIEEGQMTVWIWFTDGSKLEISAHTTEEGWITTEVEGA